MSPVCGIFCYFFIYLIYSYFFFLFSSSFFLFFSISSCFFFWFLLVSSCYFLLIKFYSCFFWFLLAFSFFSHFFLFFLFYSLLFVFLVFTFLLFNDCQGYGISKLCMIFLNLFLLNICFQLWIFLSDKFPPSNKNIYIYILMVKLPLEDFFL